MREGGWAGRCLRAANLTPDGKAIYSADVAADLTTDTLRSVVEREAPGLAMGGKIGRGDAPENAVAASKSSAAFSSGARIRAGDGRSRRAPAISKALDLDKAGLGDATLTRLSRHRYRG